MKKYEKELIAAYEAKRAAEQEVRRVPLNPGIIWNSPTEAQDFVRWDLARELAALRMMEAVKLYDFLLSEAVRNEEYNEEYNEQ